MMERCPHRAEVADDSDGRTVLHRSQADAKAALEAKDTSHCALPIKQHRGAYAPFEPGVKPRRDFAKFYHVGDWGAGAERPQYLVAEILAFTYVTRVHCRKGARRYHSCSITYNGFSK